MQTLDVISVNLWQMFVSLCNLIILFLLVKKFLYKPVKNMLAKRRATIDGDYEAARVAKEEAEGAKQEYTDKLKSAKDDADAVIKNAVATASSREKEILAEAKEKADGIVRSAKEEAALERKKAEDDIKREIVEVSSMLTEKVLGREVSKDDHARLIDSFIEGMGDE